MLLFVFLTCAGAVVVRGYKASASGTPLARGANPVHKENLRHGSSSWSLDQTAQRRRIEGFASEVSVVPGQKVHFHISTSRLPGTGSCSIGWAGIEATAPASSRAFPGATATDGAKPDAILARLRPADSFEPAGRSPTHSAFREARSAATFSPSSSSQAAVLEAR